MASPPVTTDPQHLHEHDHVHGCAAPRTSHPHEHGAPDARGRRGRRARRGHVELEHVHFRYPDGFEALRGVDLRIGPGEKVALVGPNGAGKSTLMLQLNGTLRPAHGASGSPGSR